MLILQLVDRLLCMIKMVLSGSKTVLSNLSPMAEGGILEKFPDSWDPQYLWTVVVEYLSNDHPIDILIKRLVFYYYVH